MNHFAGQEVAARWILEWIWTSQAWSQDWWDKSTGNHRNSKETHRKPCSNGGCGCQTVDFSRAKVAVGLMMISVELTWETKRFLEDHIWVCLKMVSTPKPNGFADHYPY